MDTCDREILSYIAITGGITSEMVRDLMLSSVERNGTTILDSDISGLAAL